MVDTVATTSLVFDARLAKAGADEFQRAGELVIKANDKTAASFDAATKRIVNSTSSQTKMLEQLGRSLDPFGSAVTKATRQLEQLQDVVAKGGPNAARAAELIGAAQTKLTAAQTAAARATDIHSASLNAHAKSSDAASFAAKDFGIQMIDVGQAIATGQPLFRTLVQQGAQVAQVMGTSGVSVKEMAGALRTSLGTALTFVTSPLGLLVTGSALAVGGITALSVAAETSARRIEGLKNALSLVRPDFAAAAADADAVAKQLAKTTPLNITQARTGAAALYGSGTFFGSQADAAFVIRQFSDISKLLGETEVNFQRLGDAARDPAKYVSDMALKSSHFNSVMAEQVKRLMEAGKVAEAWSIVLKANAAATKNLTDNATALETAMRKLHNATAGATETSETFALTLGTHINDRLALVVTGFARLVELLNAIPKDAVGGIATSLLQIIPVLGPLNAAIEGLIALRGMMPASGAGGTSGPEAMWEMQRRGMVPVGLTPTNVGGGSAVSPAAAGMVTIKAPSGAEFVVAAAHAAAFQGLITELEARGYLIDPKDVSSYRPGATVAGTGKPSRHASGDAVDLNASRNAVGTRGDIPPALARELAAKYGMKWGGDFSTPDPMHFGFDGVTPPAVTSAAAAFAPATDATLQRLEALRKQFDPTSASLRDLRTQYDALNEIVTNNGQIVKNGVVVWQASDEQLKEYKTALANVAGAMATTRTPQQELLHGMQQQADLTQIMTEGDRRFAQVVQQVTETNAKHAGTLINVSDATAILTREQRGLLAQTEFGLARQVAANRDLVTAYGISGEAVMKATAAVSAWNDASKLFPLNSPAWHAAFQQLSADYLKVSQSAAEAQIAQSNAASRDNITVIQAETAAVAMNAAERNRMLAGLRAENDLKQRGIPLTSDLGQAYVKSARDAQTASQTLAQTRSAYDEFGNTLAQSFDTISNGITSALLSGQGAAINYRNIMTSVAQQILSSFLRLAVINPMLNSLFPGSAHRNELGEVFTALNTPGSTSSDGGGSTGLIGGLVKLGLSIGSLFGGGGVIAGTSAAGVAEGAWGSWEGLTSTATGGGFIDAGNFHRGGIVGANDNATMLYPKALFANASRFHSGLGGSEFAAILQRGERVLTERQQSQVAAAAGGNGGGEAAPVFHFSFPSTTQPDQFRRSAQQVASSVLGAMSRAKSRSG